MPSDPIKAKLRKQRYLERKKIEKFGQIAAGVDMRGRHDNHVRAANHHRWNDERMLSEHGYVKVRVGQDHPLADPNGYAYEHLLVWVAAGRPAPRSHEVLHHRDEVKTNNRLANLALVERVTHSAQHIDDRARSRDGRLLKTGGGE